MAATNETGLPALRVVVHGRVTGVSFRWSARSEAARYPGLRGWVRNVDDDEVEAVIAGPADEVDAMLAWLRHGPPGAFVADCQVEHTTLGSDPGRFHIR